MVRTAVPRLMSVSTLIANDYIVQFSKANAIATRGDTKLVFGLYKGLYMLEYPEQAFTVQTSEVTAVKQVQTDGVDKIQSESSPDSRFRPVLAPETGLQHQQETLQSLWHRRLGHISHKYMEQLLKSSKGVKYSIPVPKPVGEQACKACLAGKMREHFVKSTDSRSTTPIRRLHTDLSGIKATSYRGYRYFLLVVDDATRYVWTRLLKDKSTVQVMPQLMQIIKEAELKTGLKVVYMRADNGKSEFGIEFQEVLRENGIQFEPCPEYKHSLNGVAEKTIDLLNILVRTMLFDAQMAYRMWDFAIEHAAWIRNRIPTSALPFKTQDGTVDATTPLKHSIMPQHQEIT